MSTCRFLIVALVELLASASAMDPSLIGESSPTTQYASPLPADRGRIWISRLATKGLGLLPEIIVDNQAYESLLAHISCILVAHPGVHDVQLAYHDDKPEVAVQAGAGSFYPREVEEVLLLHPAVAEVSVVRRPNPEWGEDVIAFVVPKSSAGVALVELHAICRAHIARLKHPKRIAAVFGIPKEQL